MQNSSIVRQNLQNDEGGPKIEEEEEVMMMMMMMRGEREFENAMNPNFSS